MDKPRPSNKMLITFLHKDGIFLMFVSTGICSLKTLAD